jgi:hypothetical protein
MRIYPVSQFPDIRQRVIDLFGFEVCDQETARFVTEYLNSTFPGPRWIVYNDDYQGIQIDAEFNNHVNATLFMLQWS